MFPRVPGGMKPADFVHSINSRQWYHTTELAPGVVLSLPSQALAELRSEEG